MKKSRKRIILPILALIVIAAVCFLYSHRDDVSVLLTAITNNEKPVEEIERQMADNHKEQEKAVSAAVGSAKVRRLTEKEKEDLQKGKLSNSQAVALTTGIEELHHSENHIDYDAQLAAYVGQIYVLEATFSGAVAGLLDSAIAEYKALPKEYHTKSKKMEIGMKYLGIANGMEGDCDAQMASLLSSIEKTLVDAGRSTELVNEIRSAYHSEKALTKEYYLSLYA